MTSGGKITIKGTSIKIEGTDITEKAAKIESAATASNKVSGAMVTVEAKAINTIKGAVRQNKLGASNYGQTCSSTW